MKEKLKKYRLSEAEHEQICQALGRSPQGVEWALFSALWSEHCSYKSSRVHLKKFSFRSDRVLESMGENAGVVDLGQGERIAFKMESHNHPSFIEPFQGAATGVGGILRDIFTMGARPIACGNYLCFGDPNSPRMRTLIDGVIRGISFYGNCVGVPTVTGQVEFHPSFNQNILVNAFALGYLGPNDPLVTSQSSRTGQVVVYVGAKTGRDGVHGASMASESFEDSGGATSAKRPTVQMGDPFYEKLLIESCLEVMRLGLVSAIQDMGAAGLTSSSFEMASKCGFGFELHLDRVPLRDPTMGPEEILLSESQERMLLVCDRDKLKALQEVFQHWNLDACEIGVVRDVSPMVLFWHGEVICEIEPKLLTDKAPSYERPYDLNFKKSWPLKSQRKPVVNSAKDLKSHLLGFLHSPQGCSRRRVFEQYDQRVGVKTVRDATQSVACLRLPHSGRGLGVALGCRPQLMHADSYLGAIDSVLYPALELSALGFEPLAVTDCLNFGNPEKREIMTSFVAATDGLKDACEALQTPIISGNVSFYNETEGRNIVGTPSTGVVGLRDTVDHLPYAQFQIEGSAVFLIQCPQATFYPEESGFEGNLDVHEIQVFAQRLQQATLSLKPLSVRVVGKAGLGYALIRMCDGRFGFDGQNIRRPFGFWSQERLYEVIWEGSIEDETKLQSLFSPFEVILLGRVTERQKLYLGDQVELSTLELKEVYEESGAQLF